MTEDHDKGREVDPRVEGATADLLERLQGGVHDLVVRHLRMRAVSRSPVDTNRTGDRFPSVRFGARIETEVQASDRAVFAGLDLAKRTVVDLGCGLGEICRDAIRAGAARACGFDTDAFLVQAARYITAYNELNNIDFHRADPTDPDSDRGQFDFVLALSGFRNMRDNLARVAAMTRRV